MASLTDTDQPINRSAGPSTDRSLQSGLLPRRTLNRLATGLVGLTIAAMAQAAFRQHSVWDGVLLFALAVVLFVRALGDGEAAPPLWLPPYRGAFAGLGLRSGPAGRVGAWLLFVALVISLIGQRLFDQPASLDWAWWFYGGGVLLFLLGTLLITRPTSQSRPDFGLYKSGQAWVLRFSVSPYLPFLIGIVILAGLLRLWQFDQIPFGVWFDEAQAGLQARQWLEEPLYKPAFYDPINVSGQFLLLYASALRFVSDSVYGLRTVSVLFGLGGVLAAYLFGATIRGPRFGLLMAFFMAVMRWHINFSRIAMTGIDTPFFELLSLYFLARLLRRGGLREAVLAGLTLGLGFSFYTGFRLFLLALGLFILLALLIWRHWWTRIRHWQWVTHQAIRISLLLLALWIAFMPVAQYAIRRPDSFSSRLQVTSIFNKREDPDLSRAIWRSLGRHVAMFHVWGDRNGRHNLPGEPMLDPGMGILFLFGLALAGRNLFSRRAKPANLFFLLLIPASLVGGVFSLDFEAPQSLRSISILPAIAYFCALPVAGLAAEAERVLKPFSPRLLLIPAGLAAFYILSFNVHTYFVRQANDFGSWNQFSTPETLTARRMAKLGPGYDFYLSPFLANHPTIRFVSPDTPNRITLSLPDALPIRSGINRPVGLFIHPDEKWVFAEAARLYPAGIFETISNSPDSPPSIYIAQLSPSDLAAIQGLELRYWAGSEIGSDQVPVKALRAETVAVDWSTSVPLTSPFVAEWVGILYVEQYGLYQLMLTAPDQAILEIDGVEIIRGVGELQATWELARGNHQFKLTVQSGQGPVRLAWQPPGGSETLIPAAAFYSDPVRNHGLLGKYFSNPNWSGSPTFMQIDPFIDAYFHLTPLPRPYSVEWTGMLDVPTSGIYGLGLRAVGEAQLFVDDTALLRTLVPNQVFETDVPLEAGLHELKLLYRDTLPRSRVHLLWRPPAELSLIPLSSRNLWPSLGSVQRAEAQVVASAGSFEAQPINFTHAGSVSAGMLEPRDIAVGPAGRVYVADSGTKQVHIFEDNTQIDTWAETDDGPFEEPLALVTDSTGLIWVLDSTRQWVYGFDTAGNSVGKIGGAAAQFYHPRGLALFSQEGAAEASAVADTLAVVNTGAGNLRLFALDGAALGSVGVFGDVPGQFNEPVDLLRDSFGTYFVSEGANINRWQRVDPFGKPLANWTLDAPVAFNGAHLTWGPDGSIFMTNSGRGVIRRYSPEGQLLEEWSTLAGITFSQPVGIFFDAIRQMLYVSDIGTRQVYRFGLTMPVLQE